MYGKLNLFLKRVIFLQVIIFVQTSWNAPGFTSVIN